MPTADFSYTVSGLTVYVTDQSWDFGDGSTSTMQNPSHIYSADGTCTVSLTVTDNDGATASTSENITVGSSTGITLSATGYRVRGLQKADLTWSGAEGSYVDIFRDGVKIANNVPNSGAYTDNIDKRGGGTYSYQVCETDGSACSNEATVVF